MTPELAAGDPMAEGIARRIARELLPGMGSMVIPDGAAELFARSADMRTRVQLNAVGPDYVLIDSRFLKDGSLQLEITANDWRVWNGILRRAGDAFT